MYGHVRNITYENDKCEVHVHFEDECLEPAYVNIENVRLLFDLEENGNWNIHDPSKDGISRAGWLSERSSVLQKVLCPLIPKKFKHFLQVSRVNGAKS